MFKIQYKYNWSNEVRIEILNSEEEINKLKDLADEILQIIKIK